MTDSTSTPSQPAAESELGFPLKGTLRRNPFPKLVRQIARTRSTGSLFLLNGNTKKVVFFEAGQPVSVRSNVLSECLGQILAREGLITQSQCDQTLESIRRTGKKQGELLVEMGILSEGNLRYGLEAQLRHKLYDIFGWDDGKYQYKPETKGDDYGMRFEHPAEGLILVAVLETSSEARARETLEPHVERFPLVEPSEVVELDIMPEERQLLASLDGSRSLTELLAGPTEPKVPSLALLLFAGIQAGTIKLANTRRAVRATPEAIDDGRTVADAALRPSYAARLTITPFEDTPLPGELPKAPEPSVPDADFDDEHEHEPEHEPEAEVVARESREVSSALVAAERDTPDETFDDFDLGEVSAPGPEPTRPPLVADPAESGFYERIAFDDDEPPLVHEAKPAEPAKLEPTAEPPALEPASEPAKLEPPEEPAKLEPAGDDDDANEGELEELDELDELEELDELDDEAADAALADAGDDVAGDDAAVDDELAAAAANLDALDDIDDDLMIDGGGELASDDELDDLALDGELPPEEEDIDDDLALDAELPPEGDGEEMVGLDELDDLGGAAPLPGAAASSPEFAAAQASLAEANWEAAIRGFEAAYEKGVDVAELHAMLAWARFKASDEAPDMAEHALELLSYAEEMNPELAQLYSYRACILVTLGERGDALAAAQRAIDLDPYDVLAIDVLDSLA